MDERDLLEFPPQIWPETVTFDKMVQEYIIILKQQDVVCKITLTLAVRLAFKVLYVYSYGLSYVSPKLC